MNDVITLGQGSGGRLTHRLIEEVFSKRFGMSEPLTDSALVSARGEMLAFTTDSYVVDPLFFPGGNIGKLAVCGTINDLAVSGAVPGFLSTAFIIEEGLPVADLKIIVESMADEAEKAHVKIVTGDTKVVERGKCDKLFINTSGTGIIKPGYEHISTGKRIKPGDKLIVNGSLGNHALAVLGARNNLNFRIPVESDCAALNHLIASVLESGNEISFMRDLTRGGLATVLNELAVMINMGIFVNESSVPVDDPVRGLCEMLGFDPLYLANEGKVLFVAGSDDAQHIVEILRSDPLGRSAEVIGEILPEMRARVVLKTSIGGERILDMLSGTQIPRIC
ncbi:MAG TPA: hydrogenase expression/formation protein HypE [Bacteroidales bacterium]|jgi:hydrogenase expression/formation protein HypE|nr:hydrogenase expression/formation protein HypE [Bacteroidales bacterium]OQB64918.1 MAG: Hydrogenase expression/formation protein HypE [Bacteroidetes bacterium ADurb.Bin145]NMD03676.1 hydrogenase expression/formation protein HypE [Bacteroidales bacterium]HOU03216.1 hydrogenase expression/formation protein HypE [Bacteroidales bacterium]HQG63701.1 hydrogenase expression/formation protein HypE [Bacteroidales bacterium]